MPWRFERHEFEGYLFNAEEVDESWADFWEYVHCTRVTIDGIQLVSPTLDKGKWIAFALKSGIETKNLGKRYFVGDDPQMIICLEELPLPNNIYSEQLRQWLGESLFSSVRYGKWEALVISLD